MQDKIAQYVTTWKARGYPKDIPDEVPLPLMSRGLAPSYKAICFAILRNDHSMQSLGFTPPVSRWYGTLKRFEIAARPPKAGDQLRLPL